MVNVEEFRSLAEELYLVTVQREYGTKGVTLLKRLLVALQNIYRYLDPENVLGSIVVMQSIDDDDVPPILKAAPAPIEVLKPESIGEDASGPLLVQILANGQLRIWPKYTADCIELSKAAIVYEYKGKVERIFANGQPRTVPRVSAVHASMFAIPCFSSLREAFEHYRVHMVKVSSCKILSNAWFDGNRIFLKAGPEEDMRDSLHQFLVSSLRGVEVRPEQNTGITNPVDIKVKWLFTNRIALIEIKWLGKSKDLSGAIKVKYTDNRARSGATQLAEYLDNNYQHAPDHVTRGYLVVFDARRWRTQAASTSIDRSNGLYYQHRDIEYDPKYHEIREDFESPVRFFMEPRIS